MILFLNYILSNWPKINTLKSKHCNYTQFKCNYHKINDGVFKTKFQTISFSFIVLSPFFLLWQTATLKAIYHVAAPCFDFIFFRLVSVDEMMREDPKHWFQLNVCFRSSTGIFGYISDYRILKIGEIGYDILVFFKYLILHLFCLPWYCNIRYESSNVFKLKYSY